MLPHDTRSKTENIVAGAVIEGEADHCKAIRNILCRRFATSTAVKEDFEGKAIIKEEQVRIIATYCGKHQMLGQSPSSR